MGHLTDDITRLCGEIHALRNGREALMKDLAEKTLNLKEAVSTMRTGFYTTHAEMAKKTKRERKAFISGLRETVAGLRHEVANDLTGARRVFFGPTPMEQKAMEENIQRRVEALRRARTEAERERVETERKAKREAEEAERKKGEAERRAKKEAEEAETEAERRVKKKK